MTFECDDPRRQLNVRMEEELMERLDEYCEAQGTSKAGLVRGVLDEHLPDDGSVSGPTDPNLLKVYQWLHQNTDERDEIPADAASSALAQRLGVNKVLVKRTRLDPLRRANWIDVDFGTITVLDPEDRKEGGR